MEQEAQLIPVPTFAPLEMQRELLHSQFCVLAEDEERCTIAITVQKKCLREDFLQRYRDFVKYLSQGVGTAACTGPPDRDRVMSGSQPHGRRDYQNNRPKQQERDR